MAEVKKIYYYENYNSKKQESDNTQSLKENSDNGCSTTKDDTLNGNSNYFWQTGYNKNSSHKDDGMDSLATLAGFNRLTIQLKH